MGNWQEQAVCQGMDTETFFTMSNKGIIDAKRVCTACPVVDQCLDWALRHEFWGVWGGMSSNERRYERRRRRIPMHAPEVTRGPR